MNPLGRTMNEEREPRPAPGTRTRRARAVLGRLCRGVLHAAPLWAPGLFLVQLLVLGLAPAWREDRRLERCEQEMRARVEALRAEESELGRGERMLADEIYRERVRRSLLEPDAPPLTLERARKIARR